MTLDVTKSEIITILLLAMVYEESITRAAKIKVIKNIIRESGDFGVAKGILRHISRAAWNKAETEYERAVGLSIKVFSILDHHYPPQLRFMADPPPVLFMRQKKVNDETGFCCSNYLKAIAIVGMRDSSFEGRAFARDLSKELTKMGATIVSGLALGIDTAAHQGALLGYQEAECLSSGIAVLGSGVEAIFPERNLNLAEQIIESGGVILSEYGVNTAPRSHFFPERNRIISGLCAATVVVEARLRSGSLITARLALEQGREVFAVPGSVNSERSSGTNALIKDGAHVLTSIQDIVSVLGSFEPSNRTAGGKKIASDSNSGPKDGISDDLRSLTGVLRQKESVTLDELIDLTGIPAQKLSSQLLTLEIKGEVFRFPGNIYSLNRFVDN